jgi:hypothetical protein
MNLTLSNEEATLLLRMLKVDFGNLRVEISNTENYNWRVEMKVDEERLRGIIAQLEQATTTA